MAELPVKKLGPYRLDRVIGQGGMGVVYAAVHEETNAPAAVKLLAPGLAMDGGFRERFEGEIESLRKLRHPNIVQLYGFGEEEGQLFYAMELIEGTNLHEELVAGRRFNWREVVRIAIDVCKALKHAHDSGVIHRDLKPANLMIDDEDNVKLTDFGIAKLFGATQVTAGRGVVGTADFMSPEQAEGKPVTPRCDLYSLGAVMYALLAGRPPFVGKSMPEVVHKLRFDDPLPVSRFSADVPVELEEVISKLLEKQPENRFPTALVLSKRLRTLEHALTMRGRRDADSEQRNSDSFELTDTQTAVTGIESLDSDIAKRPTVALSGTRTGSSDAESMSGVLDEEEKRTHFTPVTTRTTDDVHESNLGSTLTAAALLVMLIGCIGAGVYFVSLPPDPNTLYERIQRHEQNKTLLQASEDIKSFMELYPGDDRHAEIAMLADEAELLKLERQLEVRAKRGGKGTSPIETVYLEAARLLRTDPDSAAQKLQHLLDVYGDDPSVAGATKDCLLLARKKLDQIAADNGQRTEEFRAVIEARLDHAAKLDDQQRANQIRSGIVALYGEKTWASDLVERARSELQTFGSN